MYKIKNILILIGLFLVGCKSSYPHLADANIEYLRAEQSVDDLGSDEDVNAMIDPYREELEARMNMVLGELPEDLKKDRPNSNMGNWFCDALLDMSQRYYPGEVDFAIQNYGGLRLPFLGKGEITKSDIFQLMPFDNLLVVLELDANMLQRFLDDIADSNGWPLSRGIEFRIENDRAVDIKIGGKAIDKDRIYKVAMPDYIGNGWGGQEYLGECKQFNSNVYIRDAIIDYLYILLENNEKITIDNTKRIH